MAAKEMADYLDTVLPDKNVTLTLEGTGGITIESASKRDSIKRSVDGKSETRINFSGTASEWYLLLPYNNCSESIVGTLTDYWHNPDYGNGRTNSFKLTSSDTHTYVVRFESFFERRWKGNLYSWPQCIFRVLGNA